MTSRISMYRPALAGLLVLMSALPSQPKSTLRVPLPVTRSLQCKPESCKPPEAEPVLPPKSGNSATSSRQP